MDRHVQMYIDMDMDILYHRMLYRSGLLTDALPGGQLPNIFAIALGGGLI